eukprot:3529-Eustigmatos_ZCMA.PRE.1
MPALPPTLCDSHADVTHLQQTRPFSRRALPMTTPHDDLMRRLGDDLMDGYDEELEMELSEFVRDGDMNPEA